jgi:hypothetical protein
MAALSKPGLMAAIAAMVPSLPLEAPKPRRKGPDKHAHKKKRKAQRKARRISRKHS